MSYSKLIWIIFIFSHCSKHLRTSSAVLSIIRIPATISTMIDVARWRSISFILHFLLLLVLFSVHPVFFFQQVVSVAAFAFQVVFQRRFCHHFSLFLFNYFIFANRSTLRDFCPSRDTSIPELHNFTFTPSSKSSSILLVLPICTASS